MPQKKRLRKPLFRTQFGNAPHVGLPVGGRDEERPLEPGGAVGLELVANDLLDVDRDLRGGRSRDAPHGHIGRFIDAIDIDDAGEGLAVEFAEVPVSVRIPVV